MQRAMKPNGPAIKGGCVTWRSHPATDPGTLAVIYPGGKPGMACFLPSGYKFYCMQARSRYKFSKWTRIYPGRRNLVNGQLAQCRGTSYPGARICLGIESFITCRCAYPGLRPLQIYLASRLSRCKRLKRKEKFGPILNIWFLLGWRSRHQAKSMTNNLPLLSVLAFRCPLAMMTGFLYFYQRISPIAVLSLVQRQILDYQAKY